MSPLPTVPMRRLALCALLPLALAACTDPARLGGSGAGLAPPVVGALGDPANPASIAYFQSTVGDRVLFAVDQSTLSLQAEGTLAAQAAWLSDNPGYNARVEGHADEQGTREYNLALGARRAASVREYLIDRGVAPSRITTVTFGKERPLAICSEESCYAQNRRAVTILTAGLGS